MSDLIVSEWPHNTNVHPIIGFMEYLCDNGILKISIVRLWVDK